MSGPLFLRSVARFIDIPTIRTGALFESSEHYLIGNRISLRDASGEERPAKDFPLRLPNGATATYGMIVALAGDFFGLPDEPISDDPLPPRRFERAFAQLAQDATGPQEIENIRGVMQVEIDAVREALERNDPDIYKVFEQLELNGRYNRATGGGSFITDYLPPGRYLKLAKTNWDHFGDDAIKVYKICHNEAIAQAIRARTVADERELELAYAMNAFADHFLSDLFSAGHLRTPRRQMHDWAPKDLCAKEMHDEDCFWGLRVENNAPGHEKKSWRAYGDKKLFAPDDLENRGILATALYVSALDIWLAYSSGRPPEGPAAALAYVPDLEKVRDRQDRANRSPLFVADSGVVSIRKKMSDLNDYEWTDQWGPVAALSALDKTRAQRLSGEPVKPSIPLDIKVIQFWDNGGLMGMIEYGPDADDYKTLWSTDNLGQASDKIALLAVDLTGAGLTSFVQFRRRDTVIEAVVYSSAQPNDGYKVSFSQVMLKSAEDGRWVKGRWKGGRCWIAHCSAPDKPLAIDLLCGTEDGNGLRLAWSQNIFTDTMQSGHLLAMDFDGDGEDELVWFGMNSLSYFAGVIRMTMTGPEVLVTPVKPTFSEGVPKYQAILAGNVDGSSVQRIILITDDNAFSGHIQTAIVPTSGQSLTLDYTRIMVTGVQKGWRIIDTNVDGASDLVRVGALGPSGVTIQSFLSVRDGRYSAGPINTVAANSSSVGLLTSRIKLTGRPAVLHLYDNQGMLGWSVFAPEENTNGYKLVGNVGDMKQGAGAVAFFVANSLLLTNG